MIGRWLALAGAMAVVACGSARRDVPVAGPKQVVSDEVALGERVFMQKCNLCHPRGETGMGPAINNKPLPGFLMKFQVRHGLGAMPHFEKDEISPEQLDAIVAYLKFMRSRDPRHDVVRPRN